MKYTLVNERVMMLKKVTLNMAAIVVLVSSTMMVTSVHAASVKSLSPGVTVTTEDGKTIRQVMVTCSGLSKPRKITRVEGQKQWCVGGGIDECISGKIRAARKACSSRYKATATSEAAKTPTTKPEVKEPAARVKEPAAEVKETVAVAKKPAVGPNGRTKSELMKEQMLIEEQRILVEQQKIELNKRELLLQKRELEL